MRQGNGSDLLGLQDPRGTTVGIIYVAPPDDRKSVLAAILTQEKLGRKQIAIVLPESQQNKAFQRPQDFDDLKTIRRRLHAQLIFIASAGPGPAEFARQRRFSVYSSLESYHDALRMEPMPARMGKEGEKDRLFGSSKKSGPLRGIAHGGTDAIGPSSEKDSSASIDQDAIHIPSLPLPDEVLSTADRAQQTPSISTNGMEAIDPSHHAKITAIAAREEAVETTLATHHIHKDTQCPLHDGFSASMDDDWEALSAASSPQTHPPTASFAPDTMPPRAPLSAPDTPDPAVGGEPSIIELPPSLPATRSRSTMKLPAVGSAKMATTGTLLPPITPMPHPAFQRRHTAAGKMAASVTSAATPVSTRAGRSPVGSSHLTRVGALRRKPTVGDLIVAVLIIATLLICSSVALSVSGFRSFLASLSVGGSTAPATITIMPVSKTEQDSYIIQAIMDHANAAKRQVALRQLTFSPPKVSKLLTATGVGHIAPKPAVGQLTFYNGSAQDYWVGSTTAIAGPHGVSVVPDHPVHIPAAHAPTEGSITVNAHAITAGAGGNMVAGAMNETCCASGSFITVVSSPFTGGQDAKDYTFLQQSDVDSVVTQSNSTLSQQALTRFKEQIKSNEQLVGNPQCIATPTVDQPVGDQGQNITTANITVNQTCTGLAYDARDAQTLAQNILKNKAASHLGHGYTLVGTIATKQRVTDIKDGVVTLQVGVHSIWYYQFDDQQKQILANQLINKSRATAQRLLNNYPGVAKARIEIAGGGTLLPDNSKQIRLMVLTVFAASPTDLSAG